MRGALGPPAPLRPPLSHRIRRALPAPRTIAPLLIAAAVVGYLVGHSGAKRAAGGEHARVGQVAHVLIEYPAGWAATANGPSIPGLELAQARRLSPRGAADAGLLVGLLPAQRPAPLPPAFLARVRRQPQTSVVELGELQAYRYTGLSVRGLDLALKIFVVPNPAGQATALACYAPSVGSTQMRQCEQIAASVSMPGQPQTSQLTPEPAYAAAVSDAVGGLARLRASLTEQLRAPVSAASAQQLAGRLAGGYAAAGASLARLEPAAVFQRAHDALVAAITQTGARYSALAAAAAERDPTAYASAQAQIAAAEAGVDRALENLVLLGYQPR
jgi:hypothetical protein